MAWNTYEEIVASKDLSDYSKDILIRTRFPERYNEWKGFSAISTAPTQTIEQLIASLRGGVPPGGVSPSGAPPDVNPPGKVPQDPLPEGWNWEYSTSNREWYPKRDPNFKTGVTPEYLNQIQMERERLDLERERLTAQIAQNMRRDISEREAWMGKQEPSDVPTDPFGRKAFWNGREWQYPPDWNRDPAIAKAGYISPAEQKRIDIEQQRIAAEAAWRQQQTALEKESRLAELRAKPASWLEYASLAGQPAVVQPWMTGLLPQGSNLAVGQQIPGSQGGSTTMSGMPELTRPSQQYLARVGPAPTQQYYGYERARTGAPLEQTAWWLGEMAAPGGRFGGLSRRR